MANWQFDQCIARPSNDHQTFVLSNHLRTVAGGASDRESGVRRELLQLAGLLHDMGKARDSWQQYIRHQGAGVNHAFLGATLFFYLVQQHTLSREDMRYALFLCRDIACHHGVLTDLTDDPPWLGGQEQGALAEMDVAGFQEFIRKECPKFATFSSNPMELEGELRKMPRIWRKWCIRALDPIRTLSLALPWAVRIPTSDLIASDRFDAAQIEKDPGINATMAYHALEQCREYLIRKRETAHSLGGSDIADFRDEAQRLVQDKLCEELTAITILKMPTGSGKTIVALKSALLHFQTKRPGRLIYAAPYLSIVKQTANTAREATGLDVLEQHHLSLPEVDHSEKSEGPLLLMESWQSPVVVTTFNQLFGAMFPRRAQQSMRLRALHNAYLVIDEPQIMDSSVWNMFLTMLIPLTKELGVQVLIMSATLPPYDLVPQNSESITTVSSPSLQGSQGRFAITVASESKTASSTAQWAREHVQRFGSCAVILNTIADVVAVTQAIHKLEDGFEVYVIHGAMQPLHKAFRLCSIEKALKAGRSTLVVATQALEAGIDLSFRSILRARPILPSVIQAAGRANRHMEVAGQAQVSVFDFVRAQGQASRHFVYRDTIARDETDRILYPGRVIQEFEIPNVLDEYFRRVFERNNYTVGIQRIIDAANGEWSRVAGLEPFGQNNIRHVPVFVPFGGSNTNHDEWIDKNTLALMESFNLSADEIYDKFVQPGFLSGLNFRQRKRFMNLLGRFMVNVPIKLGISLTEMDPLHSVQRLVDWESYSQEFGLGHWYIREVQDEGVIL